MGRRIVIGLVMAVIAVAFTYMSGESQTTPVTHRKQRVALSDQQQAQLGLQVFQQTLQEDQADVIDSGPEYDRVVRVAKRIAEQGSKDKPEFDWQVAVVEKDEANAFCLPGGKIVVFTGILPVAHNDAQLAVVLGHEVAHATAEHGAERMFRDKVTQAAIAGASGAFADDPAQFQRVAALLGAGAQVGVSLPFGRSQESESDHIGLIYTARAGYDPREATTFWANMLKASKGGRPPEYLSTHPSEQRRIAQLKAWMPEAVAEYQKSDKLGTGEAA